MSDNNSFESKIRGKLEAYEAPYDAKYWKSYKRKYMPWSWLAFAKLWYMPYIFSSLLVTAFTFLHWHNEPKQTITDNSQKADKLFIQERLTVVDTIYVYDTVYVYKQVKAAAQNSKILSTKSAGKVSEKSYLLNQTESSELLSNGSKADKITSADSEKFSAKNTDVTQSQLVENNLDERNLNKDKNKVEGNSLSENTNKSLSKVSNLLQQESYVDNEEGETQQNLANNYESKQVQPKTQNSLIKKFTNETIANGDNSLVLSNSLENLAENIIQQDTLYNVNSVQPKTLNNELISDNEQPTTNHLDDEEKEHKPTKKKKERNPISIDWGTSIGFQSTFYVPLNYENIDFMGGFSAGFLGALSANRFELSAGVKAGLLVYEYDDFLLADTQRFPEFSQLTEEPEDIEIRITTLFVPLQLGYAFYEQNKWRVSARFGVLGQALLQENYEYVFDDNEEEIVSRAPNSSGFIFSHISAGVNAQYRFGSKWQLESGLMYNHSVNKVGYSEFRLPLLNVNLGISRYF